mmetsp:Transcript_68480/g.111138  ORF Transcript_68480/g.111138 Transcript_68480/m.111138 type:complete len:95 (+) Transcript_68480:104-388(+)
MCCGGCRPAHHPNGTLSQRLHLDSVICWCGDLSTSKMGVLAAGVLRIWRFELDGKQAHVAAGAKPRPPYSPSLSKAGTTDVGLLELLSVDLALL